MWVTWCDLHMHQITHLSSVNTNASTVSMHQCPWISKLRKVAVQQIPLSMIKDISPHLWAGHSEHHHFQRNSVMNNCVLAAWRWTCNAGLFWIGSAYVSWGKYHWSSLTLCSYWFISAWDVVIFCYALLWLISNEGFICSAYTSSYLFYCKQRNMLILAGSQLYGCVDHINVGAM